MGISLCVCESKVERKFKISFFLIINKRKQFKNVSEDVVIFINVT